MNVSKDLTAASATPLVLAILKEADSYGYSIIKKVKELSGNEILLEIKNGPPFVYA